MTPKKAGLIPALVGNLAKTTFSEDYPSGTDSKPVEHAGVIFESYRPLHKKTFIYTPHVSKD